MAVGSDFSPLPATTVHLYGILSDQRDRFRNEGFTIFNPLSSADAFREDERETGLDGHTSGILRLDTKTNLAHQQVLNVNLRARGQSTRQTADQLYRATNAPNRRSSSTDDELDLAAEGVAEYIRRFPEGHTNHLTAALRYAREEEDLRLVSDVPFLRELPDQSGEPTYMLNQQLVVPGNEWSLSDRYVHRFGPKVYLSTEARMRACSERIALDQGEINSPREARLRRNTQSGNLSLTTTPGDWKLMPGMEVRRVGWRWDDRPGRSTLQLLPSLRLERTFANVGEVEAAYTRTLSAVGRKWFLPAPYVRSFTSVRTASPMLEPFISSEVYVSFRRSNPFTFSSWSVLLTHSFSAPEAVVSTLITQANERVLSFAQPGVAVNATTLHGHWQRDYDWGDLRVRLIGRRSTDYTLYQRAGEPIPGRRQSQFLLTTVRRFIGEQSDVRLRINGSRNQFRRGEATNINYNLSGTLTGKLHAGNWQFFPEAEVEAYQLTADPLWLVRAEATAQYHRPNSPWTYGLRGAAPLSGTEVLTVVQQELFYREQRRGIFPAYLLGVVELSF